MSDKTERKRIEIPEIVRVEGHAAVIVDIEDGKVKKVELDVFEGTRFFERLLAGHSMKEIPHISSRVCAICSTGHVIAAIRSVERICGFTANDTISLFRELMHLGMIIESNATHLYALALPDFLGFVDVYQFATEHQKEFGTWTNLRNLGARIQTLVGGRPFHPVNLQVGGFSSYPRPQSLLEIKELLAAHRQVAIDTAQLLMTIEPPVKRTSEPVFLSLVPEGDHYGYFGDHVV
ncbi:MAG: nickel-dependent hydrogenase large subunit, partial [Candidatus Obscuribacterales bacterium]